MDSSVIYFFLISLQLFNVLESMPTSVEIVEMPPACEGMDYCLEKSADYPEHELKIIFDGLHMRAINEPPVTVGDREGEVVLCTSHSTLKPIYEIVDEAGYVRFVAQVENKFVQNYTITECVTPGRVKKADGVFSDELLRAFNVVCEQTIFSPKFLVLSHDKQGLEVVSARRGIPMGCPYRLR